MGVEKALNDLRVQAAEVLREKNLPVTDEAIKTMVDMVAKTQLQKVQRYRRNIINGAFIVGMTGGTDIEESGFRQGEDSCSDAAWKYANDHYCSVEEANRILRSRR